MFAAAAVILVAGVLAAVGGDGSGTRVAAPVGETDGEIDGAESVPGNDSLVGPEEGTLVADYTESRHTALAALSPDGPIGAIVSFTDFVTVDELPLPDTVTLEAVQIRSALDTDPPRTVVVDGAGPSTLSAAVASARTTERASLDAAIAEAQTDLTDPERADDARLEVERLRAAANGLTLGRPVIFAASVVADVPVLQDLVGTDGVRVVDPAVDRADAARAGIVPDDRARVSTVGPFEVLEPDGS